MLILIKKLQRVQNQNSHRDKNTVPGVNFYCFYLKKRVHKLVAILYPHYC